MEALAALRTHLMKNKALKLDAANLKTFVESGTVYTVPGSYVRTGTLPEGTEENKDFQLSYEAVIYIFDVSLDARYICWLIGEWMNQNQPEHTLGDIGFDAEILSHTSVEFEFRLKLKEDVKVTESDGNVTLQSCFGTQDYAALGVTIADSPGAPNPYPSDGDTI